MRDVSSTAAARTWVGVVLTVGAVASAGAQQNDRLRDMQTIAAALGVSCDYCHARGGGPPAVTANGKPRQDVAREMIAMTEALNATVRAAAGKAANEAVQVQCVTCHRGVPIPRPLTDLLWPTLVREGAAAAAAQYRELRGRYHGTGSYDFSEGTLISLAQRIGAARPDDAIALMELNIEFFPRSARSYVTLAISQSRRDEAAAIASLRKALEIEPENADARGRLYQLEQIVERQQRRQQTQP